MRHFWWLFLHFGFHRFDIFKPVLFWKTTNMDIHGLVLKNNKHGYLRLYLSWISICFTQTRTRQFLLRKQKTLFLEEKLWATSDTFFPLITCLDVCQTSIKELNHLYKTVYPKQKVKSYVCLWWDYLKKISLDIKN